MAKYFDDPNESMAAALNSARLQDVHFTRLAGVRIQLLCKRTVMDDDDDDEEPAGDALALRGRPIHGTISITKAEDRYSDGSDERPDARVIVNGDLWGTLTTDEQVSVMDHCLTMLEVRTDKKGHRVLDDVGRPKLRRRRFDYEVFGFQEVAERHGKHSQEVQDVRRLFSEVGQGLMPWLTEADGDDGAKVVSIARPKAPLKRIGAAPHRRGKVSASVLIDRIEQIDRPATVLALTKMEHAAPKPRPGVVKAIHDRALALTILPEYDQVLKGEDPAAGLDMAAAALVTTIGPGQAMIDELLPQCCDPTVLGWVVDDERDVGADAREDVIAAIGARLIQIRGGAAAQQ